jgi:hypothetical protein
MDGMKFSRESVPTPSRRNYLGSFIIAQIETMIMTFCVAINVCKFIILNL